MRALAQFPCAFSPVVRPHATARAGTRQAAISSNASRGVSGQTARRGVHARVVVPRCQAPESSTMSSPTAQQQQRQQQQQQQQQGATGSASAASPRATAASPAAVDDALAAAEALLGSIKAGGGTPRHMSLSPDDLLPVCDENGCVLVVQQDSRDSTEAPFQHMLSGPNWSLGLINSPGSYHSQAFATASFTSQDTPLGTGDFDPLYSDSSTSSSSSSGAHAALVAGPSWRVLLSAADFVDFVHILGQLRMAVASLRFQGLWNAGSKDRRPSQAKWEGQHFQLTAVHAPGDPGFSVRMAFRHEEDFSGGIRSVGVFWPADTTAAVVSALDETLGLRPLAARGT